MKEEQTMEIKNPKWLETVLDGKVVYGLDQEWYEDKFRRLAGCGPVTAATTLMYIGKREGGLPDYVNSDMEKILFMLNDVWQYVRPGVKGLHKVENYVRGVNKLCKNYGVGWECRHIKVSKNTPVAHAAAFIESGISNDSPVAFLNLHKGDVAAFDSWHWFALTGIRMEDGKYILNGVDEGRKLEFDLDRWIATTKKGGGFAYVTVNREQETPK